MVDSDTRPRPTTVSKVVNSDACPRPMIGAALAAAEEAAKLTGRMQERLREELTELDDELRGHDGQGATHM